MAFLALARLNLLRRSSQSWQTSLRHHSMSMKPSASLRMPFLYSCSAAEGLMRSRTVSTTFWKYFMRTTQPSDFMPKSS
eukprot:scaffold7450_cov267-Pinguiococcus_pyrenoidosus.AAC.4